MKILQLVDTLHPGGAEQMAVNYANVLLEFGVESQICVTRENGLLREKLDHRVKFHFLNKKKVYDIAALHKLYSIIRREKIDIVHAHSSSWFFAVLCKYLNCDFKLLWHDHYGNSEFLQNRSVQPIRFFSKKFAGIISVDKKLKKWAEGNLKSKKNIFLNNFVEFSVKPDKVPKPLLGNSEFNLVCVANLRPQKDHNTLLKAFQLIYEKFNVSLHILGKAFGDEYGKKLIKRIEKEDGVYYYGSRDDIYPYLYHADIGLLSSNSEALPLVLLEYGFAGLPVVCTNVGSCSEILGKNANLVAPGEYETFAEYITKLLENGDFREQEGLALNNRIKQLYSKEKIIPEYLNFCGSL